VWYVGLDLHPKQATYWVLDEKGQTVETRTCGGALKTVLAELSQIKVPFAICYEASTSYGVFYDALCGMAERVVVAHPGQLRLIGRATRKNDRFDAERRSSLTLPREDWVAAAKTREGQRRGEPSRPGSGMQQAGPRWGHGAPLMPLWCPRTWEAR